MRWKFPVFVLAVGGAVAFISLNGWAKSRAVATWTHLAQSVGKPPAAEGKSDPSPSPTRAQWDGTIRLNPAQVTDLGVALAEVLPQTEPIRLEVNGRTDYDPNTQTQIRPKFTVVIEKVYFDLGQSVKPGDPVVDVYSAELAKAKGDYEKAQSKWETEKRELQRDTELFKKNSMSEKEYLQEVNEEKQAALDFSIALDTLLVYGLNTKEIEIIKNEKGAQRAKMTIRSPAGGRVTKKDVVVGNKYDNSDTLMVITPLDHFWAWGNIYTSDASRVNIGQNWEIYCPLIGNTLRRKVESITSNVDPDSKTILIRTQIDNVGGRMKAGMLIWGFVEVPPTPGRTVIPRIALVSADNDDFVFVRLPDPDSPREYRFERRKIRIAKEYHDHVVVADGIKAGERVATKGSLILSQMYEDSSMVTTGTPL
jgi:cobalt-zinc-cadmium efflux system membrane fusion protein